MSVEQQQGLTAPAGDDFVPAVLDTADDRPGDIFGGPSWRIAPRELGGAFEQFFEMFRLRGAGCDDEHVDSQPASSGRTASLKP